MNETTQEPYQVHQELRPRGLDGISAEQISQHWTLYEGYVKNVNALAQKTAALAAKGDFGPEFAELKRRFGFEYNGMTLHERYFELLRAGQPALHEGSELMKQLKKSFGGFENWKKEFTGIAKMRGVGWAILYCDPHRRLLSNHWITLHHDGHPAGCAPILVLDVWEHAYMVDWGASGRPDYIDAYFKNLDWARAERNLQEALRGVLVG
ncbi:MAG TPA: Fe-Mn family superoxide dismutase [Elusimicrobiota bacterium]|jgi:Fe-Mn family superoxide dismutase|nr:Fe-Mn family superoxide dismutase [Elusimicrobiota bacterium]